MSLEGETADYDNLVVAKLELEVDTSHGRVCR
jgi:hypothetical protein